MNSPVCEASLNNRLIGPVPGFCPMVISLYDKGTKNIDKGKQRPSLGGISGVTRVLYQISTMSY